MWAAQALGEIGDPRAAAPLRAFLQALDAIPYADKDTQIAARNALARISYKEQSRATVQPVTAYRLAGEPPQIEGPYKIYNDKFDRFTERARKVLNLADEETRRFQHTNIGTEHLLLGLTRAGEGVAVRVLSRFGIELNTVRSVIEFNLSRGDRTVLGEVGLTPSAKKVIELAVDEARRLNHHYVGTEHLLLGLVREDEDTATKVLKSLGVNLDKARLQTVQVLSQLD
jgi:hypothetical protein